MRNLTIPVLLAAVASCTDPRLNPTSPDDVRAELTDNRIRIEKELNAWTYGSFRIALPGGFVPIEKGEANFPGSPPSGPGSCEMGAWRNPQGRLTSGNMNDPHPHCVAPASAIEIVLEPITTCFTRFSFCNGAPIVGDVFAFFSTVNRLSISGHTDFGKPEYSFTRGEGKLTGYAIDVGTGQRVGTIHVDLSQLSVSGTNLFDTADPKNVPCAIDESIESPCVAHAFAGRYAALPAEQGGAGPADAAVTGFFWFAPATEPYSYK